MDTAKDETNSPERETTPTWRFREFPAGQFTLYDRAGIPRGVRMDAPEMAGRLAAVRDNLDQARDRAATLAMALAHAIDVIRRWHTMQMMRDLEDMYPAGSLTDAEKAEKAKTWKLYFENTPEMATIRAAVHDPAANPPGTTSGHAPPPPRTAPR